MELIPFLGRFHVLLLHLPIGILTLAALAEITFAARQNSERPTLLTTAWLWGWISAAATSILGYLLSLSGGYNELAVERHLIWGIVATVVAFIGWLVLGRVSARAIRVSGGTLQIIALCFAGHLGGNLTHGPEYLFEYAPNPVRVLAGFEAREEPRPEIAFLDDADIFLDVVRPIMKNRCTSCHNPAKTQGDLLLDTYAGIMAGGKTGAAIVPGDLAASELIVRINLDPDDKKFMPTDGKPPLTDAEHAVLEWWVEIGAPESGAVFEFQPAAELRPLIASAAGIESQENEFGLRRLEALSDDIIVQLESLGFDVKRISQEIAYLDVDYFGLGDEGIPDEKISALLKAKDHIAWLNLGDVGLSDTQLATIGQLPNLLRLNIDRNPISDEGIAELASLKRLEVINLHGTEISDASWPTLDSLPRLERAFVWDTEMQPDEDTERTYAVFGLAADSIPSTEAPEPSADY